MSVRTSANPAIQRLTDPLVPQLLFEWHEHTEKVYAGETPGEHIGGEFVPAVSGTRKFVCIAEHCEHHARFYGFVQTYLRGYKKAATEPEKLRESRLVQRAEELRNSGLLKGVTDG